MRSPQGSNLCGRSPLDFKSNSLTSRTQCHVYCFECFVSSVFIRISVLSICFIPKQKQQPTRCLTLSSGSLAERSKAVASGAIPKGREFESHSCHYFWAHSSRVAFVAKCFCDFFQHATVWPSGLRRWLKAPVRKGVGSNPTGVTYGQSSPGWSVKVPTAR